MSLKTKYSLRVVTSVLVASLVFACGKKEKRGDDTPRTEFQTLGPKGQALLKETRLEVPRVGEVVDLVFKNDPGDPSRYQMDIGMKLNVGLGQIGTQDLDIKMVLDFDWLAQSADAVAKVRVPFVDQKVSLNMTAQGSKVKMEVTGKDLVVNTAGQTLVDTKKGVGMELAAEAMKEMDFMGHEVVLTVDDRGRQLEVTGAPQLVKLFEDNGMCSEGFLPLTAPDHPVKIGIPWWQKCEMKKFGNVALKIPVPTQVRYVIVGVENIDGRELIKVKVDAPMRIENLNAEIYLEDLKQNADTLFRTMERGGSGYVWFDAKRGRVHQADIDLFIKGDMNMKIQGQKLDMKLDGDVTFKMTTVARP